MLVGTRLSNSETKSRCAGARTELVVTEGAQQFADNDLRLRNIQLAQNSRGRADSPAHQLSLELPSPACLRPRPGDSPATYDTHVVGNIYSCRASESKQACDCCSPDLASGVNSCRVCRPVNINALKVIAFYVCRHAKTAARGTTRSTN